METLETELKKCLQRRMNTAFERVSTRPILVETKWKQVETQKEEK